MKRHREISLLPQIFDNDLSFIHAVREGIPGILVKETIGLLGGHRDLIAELAGTTPEKLFEVYNKPALGKSQSEGVLDLLRLFLYASSIFDSDTIVQEWLNCEIPALSGSRPIGLLDTFHGRAMVRDVLGRIECGEFS